MMKRKILILSVAAACDEFAQLKGQATNVESARAATPARSATIYNLAGEQLNEEPHTGVYIQNTKKYVK